MKRKVLFIIATDPRVSPRPAEAIRIAAGVGAWQRVEVTVVLCAAAALSLGEFTDELMDEEHFNHYLPLVAKSDGPIYVQQGEAFLKELGVPLLKYQEIDAGRLSELAAQSDCVLRF
jgi:hypothetical protein